MWDCQLVHKEVLKHRIDLLNEEVKPVYSAPIQEGPTVRLCAAKEVN